MVLYRWRSAYLEQYQKGQIIVMADTVEEARSLARTAFEAHSRDEYGWMHEVGDEYNLEALANHRKEFEADLVPEPDVVAARCLLVDGSA